jgi:integrase
MPQKRLTGIFSTRKRLSDGSIREYWYHRASGTRLPGQYGAPEFLSAYLDANNIVPKQSENLETLIREYLGSPKFERNLRPRTKAEYKRMLKHIETEFGSMPISALESLRVRGTFISYQEKIGLQTPREADNRLSVISAVLSYAHDKGRISRNPIAGFERLHKSNRADIIWTDVDVTKFMKDAPIELQRVLILAIHTGQRYSDLIHLRWSDFDGVSIRLTQSKGLVPLRIHCSAALLKMLKSTPKSCENILARADGRPWFTARNDKALDKAWRAHMEVANFYPKPFSELTKEEKTSNLHFNDLRGTAVTLLAEAGATVPQIASMTGHTLQSAARILERYLAMTPALSKAAMSAFESAPTSEFANQLQTRE